MTTFRDDVLELARTDRRSLFAGGRLRAAIAARGLDAVVASSSANVTYTGGSYIDYPPLLTFAVTTADGRQALVINEADAVYFREYSWVEDVRPYPYLASTLESNSEGVRILGELLRELGATGTVGVEATHLPALHRDALAAQLPGTDLADATALFDAVRVVKTKAEIELIAYAALATEKAIATGFALARPGHTEQQLAAAIQSAVVQLGADALDHADVHAGEHATVVHAWPGAKTLDEGEVLHVDFGAVFGGYHTDMARNAVVGAGAAALHQRFHAPLWEAQQEMVAAMRPGLTAGELYAIGKRAIERAGLVYPWGTLGHSIGLSIHEGFEIVPDSREPLLEDMVLNVEPTHIEGRHGRYHLEDTVRVTADGAERLSGHATERLAEIR